MTTKEQLSNMQCGSCKEVWNWRNREAESEKAEKVKCSTYEGKDAVIWKTEWNKREEIFCLPSRTGKKIPQWNWGEEVEWTVSRAQKERAGITDPGKVAGTVNQKAVQKKEARDMR